METSTATKTVTKVVTKAVIRVFDGAGDTILKEYDPQIADMEEVNRFIDELENKVHGQAFDLNSGDAVDKATRENTDIAVLPQWAGG